MSALPILKPRKCPFCVHEWYPRNGKPRICPKCKRELARREKINALREAVEKK